MPRDPWKNYDRWKTTPPDDYYDEEEDEEIHEGIKSYRVYVAQKEHGVLIKPGDVYLAQAQRYYRKDGPSWWQECKVKTKYITKDVLNIAQGMRREVNKICKDMNQPPFQFKACAVTMNNYFSQNVIFNVICDKCKVIKLRNFSVHREHYIISVNQTQINILKRNRILSIEYDRPESIETVLDKVRDMNNTYISLADQLQHNTGIDFRDGTIKEKMVL